MERGPAVNMWQSLFAVSSSSSASVTGGDAFSLMHWDDPAGWDGEGGGRGVQDGEHMYTHG